MPETVVRSINKKQDSVRDTITRAVILIIANTPIFLFWLVAGLGAHGQDNAIVYLTLVANLALLTGAILALLYKKSKLALILGLASPTIIFAYIIFGLVLGIVLRM